MSKYLCLKCSEIYNSNCFNFDVSKSYFMRCPKNNCTGEMVEIDDIMLQIIKILNSKNYITNYCCGGHAENSDPHAYIMFNYGVELPNIPNGFNLEKLYERVIIRSNFEIGEYEENLKNIFNDIINLINWATMLDNFEEE